MKHRQRQPTAHIVIGFIGSGKTTFAKKLEKETGAVRITKDEWSIGLIGNDPTIDGYEEWDTKIIELSRNVAFQLIERGIDVIIDEGFWARSQRDEIREKIEKAGGKVQFYYVKNSHETMKQRVFKRNQKSTADAFVINQELYDGYKKYFEEPVPGEKCILVENIEER